MVLVEVYRSYRRADCDERALVLAAVGVASELVWLDDSFRSQRTPPCGCRILDLHTDPRIARRVANWPCVCQFPLA
jgi:hypothetical protein